MQWLKRLPMKIIDRNYEGLHFSFNGTLIANEGYVSSPKLALLLHKRKPIEIEVLFGYYATTKNGADLEFDCKAVARIDFENKKADAEEITIEVLNLAKNSFNCLIHEFNDRKLQPYPNRPEFDYEEILGLVNSELQELSL
jgi:hypothetical protein